MNMKHIYNDGGRAAAGLKGHSRDCVARAVAIVSGIPYLTVHAALAAGNETQRKGKRPSRAHGKFTADRGINTNRKWFKDYMGSLGFEFVACMAIGSGCKVHMRPDELPKGKIIARVSKHFAAVIDGVLHDTHDCTRKGERCVYGYWRKAARTETVMGKVTWNNQQMGNTTVSIMDL